jgi:superfamily I DNA and RNA helicase
LGVQLQIQHQHQNQTTLLRYSNNVKVKEDSQRQSVTTFTSSYKSVTRQVSCCANKKEAQQSEKPNITLPLLHNVKGDGQISQSVTTFTSCKTVTRQVSHCANKKEVQQSEKPNIISFTSCKRGWPKPKFDNFYIMLKCDKTTFTLCKQKRSSTKWKTKYHIATFTQCKRGRPKPKCGNFYIM